MKTAPILMMTLALAGCADIKYPGWEHVKIITQPSADECKSIGSETCKDNSEEVCIKRYQRRAIIHHANTVFLHNTKTPKYAEYLSCHKPLPTVTFDPETYSKGSNTVTGQAFLRQQGGGVVTCAGEKVIMMPNTLYFTASENDFKKVLTPQAEALIKTAQCDAQGNFEFEHIPDGEWVIETSVVWGTPGIANLTGNHEDAAQGGKISKAISVITGQKNKFIVTR